VTEARSLSVISDISQGHRKQMRPVRWAVRLSVAVSATAVIIGLLVPALVERGHLLILVVGFLVGLPHGAVDHLVPFWTGWVRRSTLSMLAVLLGYATVATLTWAGLHWAGAIVLPFLLVVSVLHFGAGDLMADHDDDPDSRPLSGVVLVVAVLARGGPVVAGPLLVWPEQAGRALAAVRLDFAMPALWVRVLLASVVAACVLATASDALRSHHSRPAAEVVLLALLFTAVPPLAAFGIYFGAWHGLRHTARLVARDPRNHADLAAGRLLRPLRRFGVSAALPTLVAGGSAAALVVVAGQHTGLTGTVFTVLLALTVPHLVVVATLDLAGLRRPGRPTTLVAPTHT